MPPPNRLAPPLQNSLAYSVPAPLEPGMLPPPPSRFVPRRELENLSIGLGRGVRSGMEGTAQLLTQPVATAQALIEAARQLGTDPRIVLDMLRAARQKAMSGSLGLGELIGENVTPGVRGRRPTLQAVEAPPQAQSLNWPQPDKIPRGATLQMMSPQDYLKKVNAAQGIDFESAPSPIRKPKTISNIKTALQKGETIETPWLTLHKGKIVDQEGRHRAVAAMQAGISEMPVFIYERK